MSDGRDFDKHVFIVTDTDYLEEAERICRLLKGEGYKSEVLKKSSSLDRTRLGEGLSKQPLGSSLLIFGEENWSLTVERLAVRVGFLRDNIYIDCVNRFRVFCSQCHDICTVYEKKLYLCKSCHQKMTPSDHYSAFHKSFLAYPVFNAEG